MYCTVSKSNRDVCRRLVSRLSRGCASDQAAHVTCLILACTYPSTIYSTYTAQDVHCERLTLGGRKWPLVRTDMSNGFQRRQEPSPPAAARTDGLESNNGIRKKNRSCDVCRKRKVRCDGSPATDSQCTMCKILSVECTYHVNAKKRPSTIGTRVKELQERQKNLEQMLHLFLPGADLSGDFDLDTMAEQAELLELPPPFQFYRQAGDYWDIQLEDDQAIIPSMKSSIPSFLKGRYFGKSSEVVLLRSTLEWKAHEQGKAQPNKSQVADGEWPSEAERWQVNPWEERFISPPYVLPSNYSFPEGDLLHSLVELYFEHVNLFTPLLHRPTFERLIQDRMHIKDASIGAVVLLVSALGSRFSEDPRVRVHGTTLSSGWQWYHQAEEIEERLLAPASLYNIQLSFLRAQFMMGTCDSKQTWTITGIGLRRAQDVGAHRWQTFGTEKSAERELWVRAWWCLVVLDRVASASMGKPCITDGWDFDVGLPTECDDEFWEHPDPQQCWKQPEGTPSKISYFISHIKQTQILASARGFLYVIDKTKRTHMLNFFQDFDRRVVVELDSALNIWIDNIPEHLRNPHSQVNSNFRRQSVVLHAGLYFLQIFMHRPFLMSREKNSPMTTSSIAICTNAARACSRLFDPRDKTCGNVAYLLQPCIFSAAVVLLLSVWTGKRMGLDGYYAKELQNVEKCMAMLTHSERCWKVSGQIGDVIRSLLNATDVARPTHSQAQASTSPQTSDGHGDPPCTPSTFAPTPEGLCHHDNMPLYTQDLAKIPVFSRPPPSQTSTDAWEKAAQPLPADMFTQAPRPGSLDEMLPLPSSQFDSSLPPAPDADLLFGLDPPPDPMQLDIFNLDHDTMAMWSSAPANCDFAEWGTFVDNVNEFQMSSSLDSQMRFP